MKTFLVEPVPTIATYTRKYYALQAHIIICYTIGALSNCTKIHHMASLWPVIVLGYDIYKSSRLCNIGQANISLLFQYILCRSYSVISQTCCYNVKSFWNRLLNVHFTSAFQKKRHWFCYVVGYGDTYLNSLLRSNFSTNKKQSSANVLACNAPMMG